MMRRLIAALALAVLVVPASAQQPQEQPREHEVRRGDTLWGLAGQYLNDPARWRSLYEANSSLLADPDLILPGQRLVIPGAGAPQGLRVTIRPAAAEPNPIGLAEAGYGPVAPRAAAGDPNRTVFRQRRQASAESDRPAAAADAAIERFPVRPGEFASAPFLADPSTLPLAGRFVRSVRTEADRWGGELSSHPRDDVQLAYGDGAPPRPGDRLVLIDVGRRIRGTPESQRLLRPRGVVRVTALGPDAIEGWIEAQYGPVLPGLLAIPETPLPEFAADEALAVAAGSDLVGEILEFVDERPLYTRADLAIIDRGWTSGVQPGDIFVAFVPTAKTTAQGADDPPAETIAELRVIRVSESTATVRVDRLTLPRLRPELPVRRVRKMP